MDARSFIGKLVTVEMDRMLGSKHPIHGFIYEVNYGFIPGVEAPDGEFLDAYVLGISEPINRFEGQCIAVIHRLDDDDHKLIVVPVGMNYTNDQIRVQTSFQEQYFESVILRD